MKKQNIPLTEEEVNSLMRELKTIEIEDMADRAKIIERSEKLEKQDVADLANLMARGGKIKHKKGGGFTYNMGGKVKTMSEYMKEMLGGREMLEANFQGGGSISDIMLMNVNPMTAVQRPMNYGGPAKKKYQEDGKVTEEYYKIGGKEVSKEIYDLYTDGGTKIYMGPDGLIPWQEAEGVKVEKEPSDLTSDLVKSIDEKNVETIPVVPNNPPSNLLTKQILDQSELQGPKNQAIPEETITPQNTRRPRESDYKWDSGAWKYKGEEKYNKALSDWQANTNVEATDDFSVEDLYRDKTIPMEGADALPAESPKTMSQIQADFEKDGTIPSYADWSTAWQLENPGGPVPSEESFTAMWSAPDASQLPINDPLNPNYQQDPLTREILDQSELMGPKNFVPNQNPDYNPDDYDIDDDYVVQGPSETTVPEEQTPSILDTPLTPLSFTTTPSNLNVAKPKQTIKELLDNMNIKKNLPDYLGGAGSAISGLGPLWATQQAGLDTDEVNYFENVEDAAIAEQEKGLDIFDRGKEEARRVIERQQRQGQRRLQDYVMSAGQRRAGERALDVAAMEQIPLSDLRFDTQKSQLYNQIAQQRLQGDIYDATGATARDDKLDQNRDAYWSAMSENLTNLGTQTQNFAKNMAQKRTNQLQELAYLNNMSRGEMDPFIIVDGQIVPNPNYVGTGSNPGDDGY